MNNTIFVITFDEMHSSAVLSLLVFLFVKAQLELVRVSREMIYWRVISAHTMATRPVNSAASDREI